LVLYRRIFGSVLAWAVGGSGPFDVTATGTTTPILLNLPGVTVPAGQLLQVFAVGQPNNVDEPFQVITNTITLAVVTPTTTVAPTTTAPPAAAAPAVNTNPALTG
jgi:hypothetical protein